MEKLLLDFFGEKVSIPKPKDLSFLRIQISEQFCFSDADATEILIYYINNNQKTYIINDEDYSNFLKQKISFLHLDIDQKSKLYQDNYKKLESENETKTVELEKLVVKKKRIEKLEEEYLKSYNEKLSVINRQLDIYLAKKLDLVTSKKNKIKDFESQKNDINKKISELTQKEVALKASPKKINQNNNVSMYPRIKGALDNVIEKVKEMTNEYVFKRFDNSKSEEKENIKKITNDAVKEINNLSLLVLKQSQNLKEDDEEVLLLNGAGNNLLLNDDDSGLCKSCIDKNKNKKEFYTIRIVGEDTGVVHRGVKCKQCEQIIWEEI